jgi:hypothetical protein
MKQAIAGVAPPELNEVTIMTVWPSIAVRPWGRWWGRRYVNKNGLGTFFTWGKLWMLVSIPFALGLFMRGISPVVCRRYRLTNRRVIIQRGLKPVDEAWIGLDEFDSIDVEVLPGHEWYPAGELIFRRGTVEVFRLSGVSRPEPFRHTCLKAQRSHVGVRRATKQRV